MAEPVGSVFFFFVLSHGGIGKLDFYYQLMAMFLEMEHRKVNNVCLLSTLE